MLTDEGRLFKEYLNYKDAFLHSWKQPKSEGSGELMHPMLSVEVAEDAFIIPQSRQKKERSILQKRPTL